MYQNDYIIAFDENGKPYIAHSAVGNAVNRVASAVKNARGDRQNHKYILKIDENGRKRYFYTQDEVKAYYEEKRKQAAGAVDKAKEGVKNTVSNAKNAVREATGQAARDRMDAAAKNRDTWANARSDANDRLQKASEEKYAARQEKEQAQKEAREADNAIKGLRDKVNTDIRRAIEDLNKETAAKRRQAQATYDAYRANSVNKTNEAVYFQRAAEQAKADAAQARSDRERADKSSDLSVRAYDTQVAKSRDAHRKANNASRREQEADEAFTKANSDRKAARDLQYEAESAYKENKAAYDKSLAGAVDRTATRARDIASDTKDTASAAYNKAKDSANNTVTNAKNRFERMKSEFRDKAEQAATKASDAIKETASNVIDKAKDIVGVDERKERDRTRFEAEKPHADVYDAARANIAQREYDKTPLGMIDRARVAVKNKAEDLSAKAQSTAQSAKASAQGMIENARSSTAKAVNEAWDKIPKNADGTVNPFDSNFQSAYNDWKSKKDKYDGSLTGQAKAVAEKATDSVKDMIDKARKAISSEPPTPRLSNPNKPLEIENIETENIETENIIKENRIPERRTMEQRIEESRIPERIESTKQTAEEQRSNDKRAAQHLSASAELKGGEYVSLIDKYKQRYGEDYQKYLSKDETSRLQKARDNYQMAVEDANRAWDEFDKKWSKNK